MDEEKPISLEKYIEELEHFYKIYSLGDTNGDMAEELMIYECLISYKLAIQIWDIIDFFETKKVLTHREEFLKKIHELANYKGEEKDKQ